MFGLNYASSEEDEAAEAPLHLPSIGQLQQVSSSSDEEEEAPLPKASEAPLVPAAAPHSPSADAAPHSLPAADDLDALGCADAEFLQAAPKFVEAQALDTRARDPVPDGRAPCADDDPLHTTLYIDGAAAAAAGPAGRPPANGKRKAEVASQQNKLKNAGKVKGEFKSRKETARGGESARARWD